MNTLSWLLYAAEVLDSLKATAAAIAVIALIVGGIAAAISLVARAIGVADKDKGAVEFAAVVAPSSKKLLILSAVAAFVWAASPTAQTMYLIAASEAGEAVVTSPDAIEIMGDLREIIKKRLKEELGEAAE